VRETFSTAFAKNSHWFPWFYGRFGLLTAIGGSEVELA
jgi:hypothetical protein